MLKTHNQIRYLQETFIVNETEHKPVISFVETPSEVADLMAKLIGMPKNSRILDAGCGKGVFLESLLLAGFRNIEGIEFNESLFEACRNKFQNLVLYNDDFLAFNPSEKYDVIIGNPPYAHFNSLPKRIQNEVFGIAGSREVDIYYAFIIKSIELLKDKGEMIFIVPYGFLYNTHAEAVRNKISDNGYIEILIDLDEIKLFNGENPETVIFKFIKSKQTVPKEFRVLRLKHRKGNIQEICDEALMATEKKMKKSNLNFFSCYTKPIFNRNEKIWSSYPEIKTFPSVKLGDTSLIGVGMVSGFEEAFRLKEGDDLSFATEEKKLIFRFVKAVNCSGFWVNGCERYIIPDEKIENEDKFRKNYAHIYKKFIPHKERMSTRYLPHGKNWFEWQALRNKEKSEKYLNHPKIFVPALDRSKENRFSLSCEKFYPSADVLVIVPLNINPFFLLGYLNSQFFREYYLSYGARRGQRIAFTQNILVNINIPLFKKEIISAIAKISEKIIKEKDISKRKLIDEIIGNAMGKNAFNNN